VATETITTVTKAPAISDSPFHNNNSRYGNKALERWKETGADSCPVMPGGVMTPPKTLIAKYRPGWRVQQSGDLLRIRLIWSIIELKMVLRLTNHCYEDNLISVRKTKESHFRTTQA
jgi:hypothetical protein